jgi:hypothetical protein
MGKWDRDRTLARFVDILRTEKPDIICPTFLDIPGQHGHHRAMTEAAHLVMDLCADPTYQDSTLPPWQVSKLYLPAWSGAGQAYDDDLPPPSATITIPASGKDPVTGWSFAHIGQQSRALHATQAMGRWVPAGEETDFPLHLAYSCVAGPDHGLASGLAQTLRDLDVPGLSVVQDACDAALAAFPDTAAVLEHACEALRALRLAAKACPPEIAHKLARKEEQLARVIQLAAGVDVRVALQEDVLHPGDSTTLVSEATSDFGEVTLSPRLPQGWLVKGAAVTLDADVAISDPYPAVYLPGQAFGPGVDVAVTIDGLAATIGVPFEVPPVVLPQRSAAMSPETEVINLAHDRRFVVINVGDIAPTSAQLGLQVPDGWTVHERQGGLTVAAPDDVSPGLYDLVLMLDGQEASSVRHIRRDHIAPRVLVRPAITQVRVVDVALPDVQVGYIGGGNDRVGAWLDRIGVAVTDLSDIALTDAALGACDTLVVGIFAMKFRPGLAAAMPRIHDWVRAGGTLVTLYHRPWDNWDPDTTAPYRLEIGQPSLRWRVTDEAAAVTVLAPDHALLHQPNRIGEADWADWDKERGLYFAKDWDAAYTPLIAMNDAGETPLKGALLAADVGRGRHVHTALILHHQMGKLTPGAFRLMANLLAKRN